MTVHTYLLPNGVRPGRILLRRARLDDAPALGRLLCDAFTRVQTGHGLDPDFPDPDAAADFARSRIDDPLVFSLVAENARRIIGTVFLFEGDPIRTVGPLAVTPDLDDRGIGRALMHHVIERSGRAAGLRTLQDSANIRSLSLFASLGFRVREPLVLLQGRLDTMPASGRIVRRMRPADLRAVDALSMRLTGYSRGGAVRRALADGTPFVVEDGQRITGYATSLSDWATGHALAETEPDFEALVRGVGLEEPNDLNFLMPLREARLVRLFLRLGLRAVKQMTLMTRGSHPDHKGVSVPAALT